MIIIQSQKSNLVFANKVSFLDRPEYTGSFQIGKVAS